MATIIDSNNRKVLAIARAIARRSKLPIPTEEDMMEQDGMYYIDLPDTKKELPIGLVKNMKVLKDKTEILKKAKENPIISRDIRDGLGRPVINDVPINKPK